MSDPYTHCLCGKRAVLDGRCEGCEMARLERVVAARAAFGTGADEAVRANEAVGILGILDLSKDWTAERACEEAWARAATAITKDRRLMVLIVVDPPDDLDPKGSSAYRTNVEGGTRMLIVALREMADLIEDSYDGKPASSDPLPPADSGSKLH